MTIIVGILPSITARKGIAGRTRVVKAFEHYFRNESHKKSSLLTRNGFKTYARYGKDEEDTARSEVSSSIAFLINTIPTTF